MKTAIAFTCAGLGLALVLGVATARRSTAADDEAANVRKSCSAFVTAWNAHDPKAMAAVFAEDGDIINPFGKHAAGRGDLEKLFAAEQTGQGMLRESSLKVEDEPIRFLSAEVAVSDAEAVVSGAIGPDGTKGEPMGIHVTCVWKKSGGTWWAYASRPYIKMSPPAAPVPHTAPH